MIDKTFRYILEKKEFKTLGSSRTDAMVSAEDAAFELFLKEAIDEEEMLRLLNDNFPPDMRALSIEKVDSKFNIINTAKTKEYTYFFAHGQKAHPFSSPFLYCFKEKLDIELMKEGAMLFEGEHDFKKYCTRPKENGQFIRSIDRSIIEENKMISASFFPDETWVYKVQGRGFLRNQIRLMMGQLYQLGKGAITLEELKDSLVDTTTPNFEYIAPASGLILQEIHFKNNSSEDHH
jgi:tRNA pseudouridine38-40 synthase